jgi:L-cysteine/cystine lyase
VIAPATHAAAGSPEARRDLLASLLLRRHRRQFPDLAGRIYLNFGAQGPLPEPALAAIQAVYAELGRVGAASAEGAAAVLLAAQRARQALAAELGAAPAAIALTESASVACNVALWGIDWLPGDHLVISDREYPGVAAAAAAVARRFHLEVSRWPLAGPDGAVLERLAGCLRPRTRAVVVSHVPWDTGRIVPLAAAADLCRERGPAGPLLIVDGAQAAGVLALDLPALGVDVYACPGHKWWCGPEGTGCLFVGERAMAELQPVFVGTRGLRFSAGGEVLGPRQDAGRFEVSSAALPLYAGLAAALAAHGAWDTAAARRERIRRLAGRLWEGLGGLAGRGVERLQEEPPAAGLVFFRLAAGEAGAAARALEAQGILLRAIPHAGALRASVHYLNLDEDIDGLLAAIEAMPAGLAREGVTAWPTS